MILMWQERQEPVKKKSLLLQINDKKSDTVATFLEMFLTLMALSFY